MNPKISKMTRRKQNTPKRLKCSDKSTKNLANQQQSVHSSLSISDDEAEDSDEEEDETTSDDDSINEKLVEEGILQTQSISRCNVQHPHNLIHCVPAQDDDEDVNNKTEKEQSYKDKRESVYGQQSTTSCLQDKPTSDLSSLNPDRAQTSRSPLTSSSSGSCILYNHASPVVSPSPELDCTGVDHQMALVLPSLPARLLTRSKSSPNHVEPTIIFSVPSSGRQDDQPLDLSRKSERSTSLSSPIDNIIVSRNRSSSESTIIYNKTFNSSSSLQSLQLRFGGDHPLGLLQKSTSAVIPFQASLTNKLGVTSSNLSIESDALHCPGLGQSKLYTCSDWVEKQETTRASTVSPILKGDYCRQASPLLTEEPGSEVGGSHTILRCSCQMSFGTLYALSLHIQDTGHTPCSSKTSLMDYRKLVRGQDMWLNQESEQTRRILRCMQCGQSFQSLPLLTVHMMQTQHYTKIVSSDHGRRSHKCSTYCDRELDKECIFKCKVCHEAFTDMGGLASHMIASGHHKKASTRQIVNPTTHVDDASAISRQGKRKRNTSEDVSTAVVSGNGAFTVASLLEYKQRQAIKKNCAAKEVQSELRKRSDSKSPDIHSHKMIPCESCGRPVESHDFDSHILACLRQRAKVIDALKSKLALEEALLSRSENKLLQSGFNFSSISNHGYDGCTNSESTRIESMSKPYIKGTCENSRYIKSEVPSPDRSFFQSSTDLKPVTKMCVPNTQIYSPPEVVPQSKKHCLYEDSEQVTHSKSSRNDVSSKDKDKLARKCHQSYSNNSENAAHKHIKEETVDTQVSQEAQSATGQETEDIRKSVDIDLVCGAFNSFKEHSQKLSSNLAQESTGQSLDVTYSALHKLDMFSRGLKLSPPRRKMSSEHKQPHHHSTKILKKKEQISSTFKCSHPGSSSSPILKTSSPDPSNNDVTFDIIDPDAVTTAAEATSSALVAMESFINKSFNTKSEICASNLASMFSPFRSCFPLLGSLPDHNSILPDTSDRSQSAKFSRFFRMVPGIPSFSEVSLTHSVPNFRSGDSSLSGMNNNQQSRLLQHPQGWPVATSVSDDPKTSTELNIEQSTIPKKYKHRSDSFTDTRPSQISNYNHLKSSSHNIKKETQKLDVDIYTEIHRSLPLSGLEMSSERNKKRKYEENFDNANPKRREINSDNDDDDDDDTTNNENIVEMIINEIDNESLDNKNIDVKLESQYSSDKETYNVTADGPITSSHTQSFTSRTPVPVNYQSGIFTKSATEVTELNDCVLKKTFNNNSTVENCDNYTGVQSKDTGVQSKSTGVQSKNTGVQSKSTGVQSKNTDVQSKNTGVQSKSAGVQSDTGVQSKNTGVQSKNTGVQSKDTGVQSKSTGVQSKNTGVQSKNTGVQSKNTGVQYKNVGDHSTGAQYTNIADHSTGDNSNNTGDHSTGDNSNNTGDHSTGDHSYNTGDHSIGDNSNNTGDHSTGDHSNNTGDHSIDNSESIYKSALTSTENVELYQTTPSAAVGMTSQNDDAITGTDQELGTYPPKHILTGNCGILKLVIQDQTQRKCQLRNTSVSGNQKCTVTTQDENGTATTAASHSSSCCSCEDGHDTDDVVDDNIEGSRPSSWRQTAERRRIRITVDVKIEHGSNVTRSGVCQLSDELVVVSGSQARIGDDGCVSGCQVVDHCDDGRHDGGGHDAVFHDDGDRNSGDHNRGDHDDGDRNSGYHVVYRKGGDDDVGDHDDGDDHNSSDHDDGDHNSGYHVVYRKGGDDDVGDHDDVRDHDDDDVCDHADEDCNNGDHKCPECDSCCRSCSQKVKNSEVIQHRNLESNHDNNINNNQQQTVPNFLEDQPQTERTSYFPKASVVVDETSNSPNISSKSDSKLELTQLTPQPCESCQDISLFKDTIYKTESPDKGTYLLKHPIIMSTGSMVKWKKRKSALDSLSSFVSNQPLTTEHPLDSLQRLLSTSDLKHFPTEPQQHLAASSYKCLTPDLSTSQKLTWEGAETSGGCSRDEDDDDDFYLNDGDTNEGDLKEYRCPACSRRLASKGSYRYHLSRCHLSSVKKCGIKEAFNMSPYVYLPLDHTAKFSSYYHVAHEPLANSDR